MSTRSALLLLLLVTACGREAAPPAREDRRAEAPSPEDTPGSAPRTAGREEGGNAAAALRRYYALLEAGDYDGAWRMRSGRGEGAQRLAENFRAYATYRANVGGPSQPVEAGGWLYVEVPVMITGTFKGGKPFGSSGSVTLRRATPSASAAPAERDWHIYAG